MQEMRETRDKALEEKYLLEEKIDGQKEEIENLNLSLSRTKDDVECRKLIIEELSKAILGHEKESAEMATKMTLLMN